MAGIARASLRVIRSHHLRKCLRLRAVRLVTTAAYDGCIELGWFDRCCIVSMLRLRPMTGLTGNNNVSAQFLLLCDVCVATFADLMPGMSNGLRCNLSNRSAPVVSLLSKTLGHHCRT